MAQTRPRAGTNPNDPHSISLKVLRLSRPSLATQTTLPQTSFGNGLDIAPNASLAYPSADPNSSFPLTPLLTLPPAFGAAYVGETFACTLCINNELSDAAGGGGDGGAEDGGQWRKSVGDVEVGAELQTPGHPDGVKLDLRGDGETQILPGGTTQRSVHYDLKEDGTHVLAVTVSYTETLAGASGEPATRTRTFRKLYQFVAQQLIAVRSKVTELKRRGQGERRRWVLEAQLENVGEASVVLEEVALAEREGFEWKDANVNHEGKEATVLKPQDVEQIMFVIEESKEHQHAADGRLQLAQLVIGWRGAMGEKGGLTTGWLTSRPR